MRCIKRWYISKILKIVMENYSLAIYDIYCHICLACTLGKLVLTHVYWLFMIQQGVFRRGSRLLDLSWGGLQLQNLRAEKRLDKASFQKNTLLAEKQFWRKVIALNCNKTKGRTIYCAICGAAFSSFSIICDVFSLLVQEELILTSVNGRTFDSTP